MSARPGAAHLTGMSELDPQHVDAVAEAMCPPPPGRARTMAQSARNAQRVQEARDFAETLLESHEVVPLTGAALREALERAEGWVGGYDPESTEYWRGMRDTLRVLLGITTQPPMVTGPGTDAAAVELFGARDAKRGA